MSEKIGAEAVLLEKERTPLGGRLVWEWDARGLSQKELAELADLSEPTIVELECGALRFLAPKTAHKLPATLEIGSDNMFGPLQESSEVLSREDT